jgi:hypothetical protein
VIRTRIVSPNRIAYVKGRPIGLDRGVNVALVAGRDLLAAEIVDRKWER